MLANIFDPVQKCCANWTTRSNMYQHSPTSTNIRQQGEQTFPTCCANNVGAMLANAMLANMLRWFKPALTCLSLDPIEYAWPNQPGLKIFLWKFQPGYIALHPLNFFRL